MTDEKTLRDFLPERLRLNYDAIRNTKTATEGALNVDDIATIQQLINDSQPKTPEEEIMRTMLQFLYRRNTRDFYKFLVQSKLYHLVLWTEAKQMAKQFRLNGLIYIHWNGDAYECSKHQNPPNEQDKALQSFNKQVRSKLLKKAVEDNPNSEIVVVEERTVYVMEPEACD